jgi:SAM-dependent methyltransferase
MNATIEALLEMVEADPLPAGDTSSHWQRFGRDTTVERRGDDLLLHAAGFETVERRGPGRRVVELAGRLTYRRVVRRFRSYPAVWRAARRLAGDLRGDLTFGVFKSAAALALLADHWSEQRLAPRTFTVIGDGYGFLGALIRRYIGEGVRLYCIDLPKMLMFQARTHERADADAAMSLLTAGGEGTRADVMFARPTDIERIVDEVDCAINIASMQEMNAQSIAAYFDFLRRRSTPRSRFYCVNRRDKELPGGEVSRFADYPWRLDDEVFVDGVCPYYTHFVGLRMPPRGPRWLGLRVPFVNHFDGVHLHRLARLASPPR